MPQLIKRSLGLLNGKMTRQGGLALVDQAVVSATNVIIGIMLGRHCSKEEFGLYSLGFSMVLLIINVQNSLICSPYCIFSPRLKGQEHLAFSGSSLIHQIFFSALATIILIGAGLIFSTGFGPVGMNRVAFALSLAMVFILFKEFARQISFANLQIKNALIVDLSVSLIQIFFLFIINFLEILSASNTYLMTGISCCMPVTVWLFTMRKRFTLNLIRAIRDLANTWSLAKWMVGTTLVYTLSNQLYPWVLAIFQSVQDTGVLAACMSVIAFANPFFLAMANFLGPQTAHAYAQGGVKQLHHIVFKATLVILFVMGLFCLTMSLFGNMVIQLMYGHKYLGQSVVLRILALSQLVSVLTYPINAGLFAMGRADAGFKSYVLSTLVALTLGLYMVKSYGVLGVAYSLLAGNIVASLFRWMAYEMAIRSVLNRRIAQ